MTFRNLKKDIIYSDDYHKLLILNC